MCVCVTSLLYIYIYVRTCFFHCQVAEGKWRAHPELPEREDTRLCLVNYCLVVFSFVLDFGWGFDRWGVQRLIFLAFFLHM